MTQLPMIFKNLSNSQKDSLQKVSGESFKKEANPLEPVAISKGGSGGGAPPVKNILH